jgi:hypothetical protein
MAGSDSTPAGYVRGKTRNTTVGQDLQDIAKGIGNSIGGALGNARDVLKNRSRVIDSNVDAADPPGLSQQEAQSTDRHNGY